MLVAKHAWLCNSMQFSLGIRAPYQRNHLLTHGFNCVLQVLTESEGTGSKRGGINLLYPLEEHLYPLQNPLKLQMDRKDMTNEYRYAG